MNDSLINNLLGDYRITERIGEGGFALVYKGTHRYLGSTYALKVLRPERTISQRFVKRFAAEARITAELKHPNIVRIVDFFISRPINQPSDLYCFAMDYIPGPTLARILSKKGPLDLRALLEVFIGVAEALEYAHRPTPNRPQGIVHRDIKPENIKFTYGGDPVVMDFGIADALSDGEANTGIFFGSPSYMSPEQGRGDVRIDARADIYSLGVMMYEAFTGWLPFSGDPETVRKKHLEDMVIRPDALRRMNGAARRPAGFTAEIIMKCLMKNPAGRYPNCAELIKHLRLVERDRGVTSLPRSLPAMVS